MRRRRKRKTQVAKWLTLGIAAHALAAAAGVADPAGSLESRVSVASHGAAQSGWSAAGIVRSDPATGNLRFVRVAPGGDLSSGSGPAETRLNDFLDTHGARFGLDLPDTQLRPLAKRRDAYGFLNLTYGQIHGGVPVFGAVLRATLDPAGRLTTVTSSLLAGIAVPTVPDIGASAAIRAAQRHVAERAGRPDTDAGDATLYVYRLGLARWLTGPTYLVYRIRVTAGFDNHEWVFVDAHSGKVVDSLPAVERAMERIAYDGGFDDGFIVWREGDPLPYGVQDVDNVIEYAEDTYNLYSSMSGGTYLSWDGQSGPLRAVLHPPDTSCPNAGWNGEFSFYCAGYTTDDVVAHEFAHGATDATHDLISRWQPGALNEAYADIFGEIVDILNQSGLDQPDLPRDPVDCSEYGGHLPPLTILAPAHLAGTFAGGDASFNPPGASASGGLALADDGVDHGSDACTALINPDEVAGRIAVLENFGRCASISQVRNAHQAGASGVILINSFSNVFFDMGGVDPSIDIPSTVIGRDLGERIKEDLPLVEASVSFSAEKDPSLRWLHREGFAGGPNRDMWNPACFGDAGRVGDALYYCSSDDSGGVHHNSGISNHLFALLVDGGAYNGQVITALGLTRAAHIYWRAQTHYQTPVTDFPAHADALEAACDDLMQARDKLFALSTDSPEPAVSDEIVSAADCAALALAIEAVELRLDPAQCEFRPLLEPDPPPLCDTNVSDALLADFEDGLGGWRIGRREIADPATFDTPDWAVVGDLPDGRAGSAAFVPDLITGNCSTDTEAGVLYLESPPIEFTVRSPTPRISFDHWVATEAGYDGGNVKISLNGSPFRYIPAGSFVFNAYTGSLFGSDNPLGGEPAFHGSDGNSLRGTWGQSQIDLAAIYTPGDTLVLRFEMGLDGCNGLLGWYVDDVRVTSCLLSTDLDHDGVSAEADNCTEVANPRQIDIDGDGFGNLCDGDFNDDGSVNALDLAVMKEFWMGRNGEVDLNSDGYINTLDLAILKGLFFRPPGPSGVAR